MSGSFIRAVIAAAAISLAIVTRTDGVPWLALQSELQLFGRLGR
jgi:hypothetical protein